MDDISDTLSIVFVIISRVFRPSMSYLMELNCSNCGPVNNVIAIPSTYLNGNKSFTSHGVTRMPEA